MKISGFLTLFFCIFLTGKTTLQPAEKYKVNIDEPSDICYDSVGKGFFMVSDNGQLFRTDSVGTVVQKAKYEGADFEGVWADDKHVYVVDESLRTIHTFDIYELTLKKSRQYAYHGGRNRGWESICWNAAKERYVLLTEKQPVLLFEFDANWEEQNRLEVPQFREISAATAFNGALYFLADEDRTIFEVNANTYAIERKWTIPILNPEGICFTANGNCYIISDDLEKLYLFNAFLE